jgi:hypothetical protein
LRTLAIILALAAPSGAEILDRTVALVGTEPILRSEVRAQVRLEAMFDDRRLDESPEALDAALERLIDQKLLSSQIALSGMDYEEPAELERQLRELSTQTFAGLPFQAALARYGLTAPQAQDFLRRQLRFANYIRFRFRSGLEASADEVRRQYRETYGAMANPPPLTAVEEELADIVRMRAAEADLADRIRTLRATTRILKLPRLEVASEP